MLHEIIHHINTGEQLHPDKHFMHFNNRTFSFMNIIKSMSNYFTSQ